MEKKQKGRSGIAFFFFAVGLIFAAIAATVLLANEQRNLKQVLSRLGFQTPAPQAERQPRIARGPREKPEQPKGFLPAHIFADLQTPEQQFIRQIRSDPRALCEGLSQAGFRDLEWKSAESGRWECSSLVPFVRPGQEPSSSIFILVKGRGEEEITSFRVKLNIEHGGDTPVVTSAAARAASVFLNEVRWAGSASVTLKIQALQEFDLERFGSRIQFQREMGDTPRYNFLANQAARMRPKSVAKLYFDRDKWLTPGEGASLSFIRGPSAWPRPGPQPATPGQ